jgi:4'-phosphopantetheinyl transferase
MIVELFFQAKSSFFFDASFFSPEEQKAYEKKSLSFLQGRAFIKSVLAKKIGLFEKDIPIFTDDQGKPFAKNAPFFSLTHTQQGFFFVCGEDLVGVDAELLTRQLAFEKLSQRFFCETEKVKSKEDFLQIWTKKEAYLKALGIGIRVPLKSVKTDFESVQAEGLARFFVKTFFLQEHCVSVCAKMPFDLKIC